MSAAPVESKPTPAIPPQDIECHVFDNKSPGFSIQCQPLAAQRDNDIMWPATVCYISPGRIGLVVQRRFELRTRLSLSLPDSGSDSVSSVFAHVTRVEPHNHHCWFLGCTFDTPLNPERLNVFPRAAKVPATPEPATGPTSNSKNEKAMVLGVLFQVRYGTCKPIRRVVTRLYVNGRWPPATGRAMKVWVGSGPMNESTANVRVNGCYKQGKGWLIDCYFLGAPPDVFLEKLRTRITDES